MIDPDCNDDDCPGDCDGCSSRGYSRDLPLADRIASGMLDPIADPIPDSDAECPDCGLGLDECECDDNDACTGDSDCRCNACEQDRMREYLDDDWDDFDDDPLGRPGPGYFTDLARRCRVCGCDDAHACMTRDGPCSWVEEDLCSACARVRTKGQMRRRRRKESRARKARVRWLHRNGMRSPRRY